MLRVDPYPSALAFAASERLELDLCRLPQIDSLSGVASSLRITGVFILLTGSLR